MRPIIIFLLPLAFSLLVSASAPPLPVCERDYQPACTTPTLAIPPTEPPTTAYP